MKTLTQMDWHQLPSKQVADILESDALDGLAVAEAEARMRQFGPNQITAQKRRGEWVRFLLQFHQALIYILLASTVVSAAMGKWVDASVIFAVAFINAVVGYLQEAKAEKARPGQELLRPAPHDAGRAGRTGPLAGRVEV